MINKLIDRLIKNNKKLCKLEDSNVVLVNRPKEGEIVNIENIRIKENFINPSNRKMKEREQYYKNHSYFKSVIVLDNNNYLIDGYTTYLLAKKYKFNYITIVRNK